MKSDTMFLLIAAAGAYYLYKKGTFSSLLAAPATTGAANSPGTGSGVATVSSTTPGISTSTSTTTNPITDSIGARIATTSPISNPVVTQIAPVSSAAMCDPAALAITGQCHPIGTSGDISGMAGLGRMRTRWDV